MRRLGKKRSLINNQEGLYMLVDYKDENGYQEQDHDTKICIIKDCDE